MEFEKAKTTYRKKSFVQKQMAHYLIKFLIKNFKKEYDTVFEIGSGTGFLTDEIREKIKYKKIILNDLTDNFTNFEPDIYIKGDINKITLPKNVDLILSNAVFQWVNDYETLFKRLRKIINKEGLIAFSYFGKKNFIQIKDITGIGLEYPVLDDFIKKEGFKILYFEEELKTLYFKDVHNLLDHIKFTGVKAEDKVWTKKDYNGFKNKYFEKYKDNMGFELTYHPLYYVIKAI